jgi:hypothetical protein
MAVFWAARDLFITLMMEAVSSEISVNIYHKTRYYAINHLKPKLV